MTKDAQGCGHGDLLVIFEARGRSKQRPYEGRIGPAVPVKK